MRGLWRALDRYGLAVFCAIAGSWIVIYLAMAGLPWWSFAVPFLMVSAGVELWSKEREIEGLTLERMLLQRDLCVLVLKEGGRLFSWRLN